MNIFVDMMLNFPLVCAGVGWLTAQIIKVFTGVFRLQKFDFLTLMFGTGGMPSSHSAAVCALTMACALSEGVGSVAFAVSFLLTLIVMRDATGVRQQVGEQAKILNRIMQDLVTSTDQDTFDRNLKELVGHTAAQVFVGALVGVSVPFLMSLIPVYGIWG